MYDFEEKYHNYLKTLKNELPYALGKAHHDFEYDFRHNFIAGNSFLNIIAILWWVCGSVAVGLLENKLIIRLIVFIVWLGIGIWYWIFNDRHSKDIADYFFYQYEYKKIIEDRIKRDQERDVKKLLDEMFNKYEMNIIEIDDYKLKLKDIRYFYDRCLSDIKYENFEEKYY